MKLFNVFKNSTIADVLCEATALNGVKRIAKTISNDLLCVTGKKPNIHSQLVNCKSEKIIIIATIGNSAVIDLLIQNNTISIINLSGKRECYLMKTIETPFKDFPQIKQALFIIGSDKRGTIYGMFHLSEMCGVSPLIFWGDAAPAKKEEICLSFENEILSKEPSVTYRGFFINDEWPAFGKWCTEKYGGVNANAYDKVFELVLRLKGNYLWPAMWKSSFWEDGSGLENARLADEYGVIMGTSHHEPLCRAGVEWQRQYKNYGNDNAWSFVTNSDAITEFWKDGIKRSKGLENVITVGMRGEDDSKLMENASLQDNINVIKNAIVVQNKLIKENVNSNLKDVPRMLAIYKEVEDFFFGASDCEGLRGWEEIEDVILLLSDDNYGNLRAIPQPTDKPHPGGYGIYYHFDYHGAPFSYEWLNNTNIVKAWEQLATAYEYGIRKMWIVNVGDIKGNEYPLSFFMNLAYDFEKWGTSNINSAAEYTDKWIDTQFGDVISGNQKERIRSVLNGYTQWSTVRITESLNAEVYYNNFHEIENTKETIIDIISEANNLQKELPEQCLNAYNSMIYYPAVALLNTVLLNLDAGMNHIHAKRGTLIANKYSSLTKERIAQDKYYVNEFHKFLNGKWNHMMESAHMCFRNWDDNNWTYPVVQEVCPVAHPKIVVSFRGSNVYNLGHHWQDKEPVCNDEMTRPDVDNIIIDIDSRGDVDYKYTISCDKSWLSFSQISGSSCLKENPRISIQVKCDRNKLISDDIALINIDFVFINGEKKRAYLNVKASNKDYSCYSGAFLESQNYVCIHADHFTKKTDISGMGWQIIPRLGRTDNAIKSFPFTKNWETENHRPLVQYDFVTRKESEYIISFYFSPKNPMIKGGTMKSCFSVNDNAAMLFDIVSDNYYAEWYNNEWSYGVTNKIRIVNKSVYLKEGLNNLKLYAADPSVILEKIVVFPKDTPIPSTHLSPPESYRML